mgnify:CR=1 FL=1
MNKSRCLVRCKAELQPETLCEVINKTKVLSAQQVVKNERGEEVRRLRGLDKIRSPTNWGKTTSSQSRHVASIQEPTLDQAGGSWETKHQYFLKLMFPVVAHTLSFLLWQHFTNCLFVLIRWYYHLEQLQPVVVEKETTLHYRTIFQRKMMWWFQIRWVDRHLK